MSMIIEIAKLPASMRATVAQAAIDLCLVTSAEVESMERAKREERADNIAVLRQLFETHADACAIARGAKVFWRPASLAA